nr:RNA-directed DNA polymerase, eukaryota [Tanacetum cinerariifolium]
VINLDRLIENLNTIWIDRFHLFANPVRFERPKKPNLSPHNNAAAASSYPRGGEALDIEDNVDSSFGRKRLCIQTKLPISILESFKVTFKGDESNELSSSLSHPPGFTPDVSVIRNENGQSANEIPVVVNAKVMNNSQDPLFQF